MIYSEKCLLQDLSISSTKELLFSCLFVCYLDYWLEVHDKKKSEDGFWYNLDPIKF